MGLVKEPKNVDFFVIDNPWTDEERKEFSELIKKEKSTKKLNPVFSVSKKHFA
jgi:hypothetical protein